MILCIMYVCMYYVCMYCSRPPSLFSHVRVFSQSQKSIRAATKYFSNFFYVRTISVLYVEGGLSE